MKYQSMLLLKSNCEEDQDKKNNEIVSIMIIDNLSD